VAAVVAVLVIGNVVVAVRHLGVRAGQTYRWVCRETGTELSYSPSQFGSVHLTPADVPAPNGRWELIEPRPPAVWLPWNWLAAALQPPAPDPNAVIRNLSNSHR
jgi:hypothetical protein